jgi:c-di-GMP-binding flagellar brake protein YcgR
MVAVPVTMYDRHRRLVLQARTMDLSTTGALLHGSVPLPIGETVHVEMARGEARNPLRLDAEVVRISEPKARRRHHGVAVRFTNISDLDATLIDSIIAQARA